MQEKTSFRSVKLRNNGLTSFVPPCFSWEVVDPATEEVIATASELSLDRLDLDDRGNDRLMQRLYGEGVEVDAQIQPVPAVGPLAEEGRRLVVHRVGE